MLNWLRTAIAAAVLTAGLAAGALADQKGAELPIAIIDTQLLLEKAEAARSARQQIEKLRAEIMLAVGAEQQEIRQMGQALAKERAALGEEVFQQRMRELMQKNTDQQRSVQERQQKLDAASRAAAQKIEAVVHEIVDEFKKERSYVLVVVRSATMGKPTVPDITQEVMGRLDRRLPTVEVTLQ
jgi:Skp family chaperone for outer membrane proteins